MYIYLEDAKKHLNIDQDFLDDDMYIASLIQVAEEIVQQDIDTRLVDLEDDDGDIPNPLKQAMLLLVGNFYANRESVAYANMVKVPYSYQYLIDLYKNYRGRNLKKDKWLWCKLQHNKKVNPEENDVDNNDENDDEG